MIGLRRWMQIVGAFYVLMGVFNTPPIINARFSTRYPEIGFAAESTAGRALNDVWFMFGLEIVVIGAALLYFARKPTRHIALVWTVIGLELLRGVAFDLYLIARGTPNVSVYLLWILIHLVVIVSGVIATRRAGARTQTANAGAAAVSATH